MSSSGTIFKPFNSRARVVVIKLFPGITGEYIRTTLGAYPVHGVVFELFGIGDAPTDKSFLKAIEHLRENMVLMIGVSQCIMHDVDEKEYKTSVTIQERGVFGGGTMTTEAALAKLYYLITNASSYEEATSMISTSLRGEIIASNEALPMQT